MENDRKSESESERTEKETYAYTYFDAQYTEGYNMFSHHK